MIFSMEDNSKKPFACTAPGCGATFTNEDHLTVHKKKHDMILNLENGQKANIFVADQTPTPTRFIRNCEEVGLFQDLQNVNPFEEQFRKAVEAGKSGITPIHQVDSLGEQTDDTLHTPHIFPPIDAETSITSTTNHPTTLRSSSEVSSESGREGLESLFGHDSSQKQILQATSTTTDSDGDEVVVKNEADTSLSACAVRGSRILPKPTISDKPAVTLNISNANSVQNAKDINLVPQTITLGAEQLMSPKTGAGAQLFLRMSDGKVMHLSSFTLDTLADAGSMMSVQNPPSAQPTVQAAVMSSQVQEQNRNANKTETVSTSAGNMTFVKLKLKQSLTKNASVAAAKNTSAPPVKNVTSGQRRRLSSSDEVEGEEKRQKFLERNRAAAYRCREKRKKWIYNLEKRSNDLQASNTMLQKEVGSLRLELTQLKTLLLAHKDCSVTRAMQEGISIRVASSGNTVPLRVEPVCTTARNINTEPQVINVTLPTFSLGSSSVPQVTPIAVDNGKTIKANNQVVMLQTPKNKIMLQQNGMTKTLTGIRPSGQAQLRCLKSVVVPAQSNGGSTSKVNKSVLSGAVPNPMSIVRTTANTPSTVSPFSVGPQVITLPGEALQGVKNLTFVTPSYPQTLIITNCADGNSISGEVMTASHEEQVVVEVNSDPSLCDVIAASESSREVNDDSDIEILMEVPANSS